MKHNNKIIEGEVQNISYKPIWSHKNKPKNNRIYVGEV